MLKSICPKTRQFCLKHGRFTSESLRKSLGIWGYLNFETRPSIFRFMQGLTNNNNNSNNKSLHQPKLPSGNHMWLAGQSSTHGDSNEKIIFKGSLRGNGWNSTPQQICEWKLTSLSMVFFPQWYELAMKGFINSDTLQTCVVRPLVSQCPPSKGP